jgi:peptidoglycan/xylan/chitin deacetylase (PgdA/CDA1 family)
LFAAHLDELVRHAEVVPLDTALSRSPRRRQIVLTFDDAYRGTLTLGVTELARRGLPATIFVPPGFLGEDGFWWDALAVPGRGLDAGVRNHALTRLGGRDHAARQWARETGLAVTASAAFARVAGADELGAAAGQAGITLGSHSWSHPDLSQLGSIELAAELVRSRDWLAERFPSAFRPWLSFPYGSFSHRVVEEAQRAGYQATLRIDGGWCRGRLVPDRPLPRLNVPANLSPDGLALRVAGLFCR